MAYSGRLQGMSEYSGVHFSVFRIIFGVYLFLHFSMLVPYGEEIWSNEGLLKEASLNMTFGVFPNVLNIFDSPFHITLFLGTLSFLSLLFAAGVQRRVIALLLWYGWACLFNRNNLISNPGIPFVGWLLLACAIIPQGETIRQSSDHRWNIPALVMFGAWLIMSISYTISGIDKLQSPSWIDGSAIKHLLNNPLSRNWFLREWMLLLPEFILHIITWLILAVEVLFAPLCLLGRNGRMWAWVLMTGVHLGILLIVDFADLTSGMLMVHLFTFDQKWLDKSVLFKKVFLFQKLKRID